MKLKMKITLQQQQLIAIEWTQSEVNWVNTFERDAKNRKHLSAIKCSKLSWNLWQKIWKTIFSPNTNENSSNNVPMKQKLFFLLEVSKSNTCWKHDCIFVQKQNKCKVKISFQIFTHFQSAKPKWIFNATKTMQHLYCSHFVTIFMRNFE